jgi:23S rRNA (adenine2503-C2)-methyltransferase
MFQVLNQVHFHETWIGCVQVLQEELERATQRGSSRCMQMVAMAAGILGNAVRLTAHTFRGSSLLLSANSRVIKVPKFSQCLTICSSSLAIEENAELTNTNRDELSSTFFTSSPSSDLHHIAVAKKRNLKDMTFPELQEWVESLGQKPSRAVMLWKWLYGNGKWAQSTSEIQGLNREFRAVLEKHADFGPVLVLQGIHHARDGTRKLVFLVEEFGAQIETVLIPGPRNRVTVCVSSQIGCAMNCQFCYTAKMGLKGNLSTAHIVEQLVVAARMCSQELGLGLVTNVVFMGMGEPFQNIDNVVRAAEIMTNGQGLHLSPRKVTISTSGLVPQIRTFCRTSKCALAISLNATTDEVRDQIMPVNRKYKLMDLLDCVREELVTHRPGEKVFFEYVLLKNVNDSTDDAKRLVDLVCGIPCKINLITFNLHEGSLFEPTPLEDVLLFRDIVASTGIVVSIRHSRGDDQKMACGQLGSVTPRHPKRRNPEIRNLT